MYAQLVAYTGWTLEYIGQKLDLPRVKSLFAQWEKTPTAAQLLAFLASYQRAWKPKGAATSADHKDGIVASDANDGWLLAMFMSSPNGSI